MRVLVAGATGLTGRRIAVLLAAGPHHPVALVRYTKTADLGGGVELREGDLEAVDDAMVAGIDAILFAAGSGSKTGPEKTTSVDRDGAIALIDAANRADVKHFVMLSAKGAEEPDKTPEGIRHYMQAKRGADDYLVASSLHYTILRPVILTNNEGVGQAHVANTVDPDGEISCDDVAALMVLSLDEPSAKNRVVEMTFGPTPLADSFSAMAVA